MTTPSGLPTKALQYWGVAMGAAEQRANTADTWAAIRDASAQFGNDRLGLSLQDFNQLRSAATGVRNSSERLNRAPEANTIDQSMIGLTPYARSQADRNATPQWSARFLHLTTNTEGDETEEWRMVRFTGQLPTTVGELMTAVQQDAQALADKYGTEHVSFSGLALLAI